MAAMPQRLASLVAQLVPGEKAVRLIPAGEFRSGDGSGRPHDAPAWRLDAAQAARLIARDAARASRRVVDYEHQTLLAAQNGQPAPAAGWITGLEWRAHSTGSGRADEAGLYAAVEWTEKAAAMIAAGEYRYLSPVFAYDATGLVLDIGPAALTNNPGLDGLTDLAALSALYIPDQEITPMKELLKALGLADTATEAEALTALAALKAKSDEGATRLATLTAEVATLKAAAPDPAKYVPVDAVAALTAEVAALKAAQAKGELDSLVEAGLSDGRLNAALEPWARTLTPVALKAYLDKATPIAALKGTQTGGKKPDDVDTSLPADERCKAEWAKSAALRAEFTDVAAYTAYTKANEAGLISVGSKE